MSHDSLNLPLVEELPSGAEATAAWSAVCRRPYCLFLDSAMRHETLGRYSFLAVDPFEVVSCPVDEADAFGRLARRLAPLVTESVPDLPPFQGGAAGLFSYDLNRSLERITAPRHDEFGLPALLVGLYDVVLAFDHREDRAWIISQGFPATENDARRRRAEERLAQLKGWLAEPASPCESPIASDPLPASSLAPQYPTGRLDDLTSNFSHHDYLTAIRRVVEYIHAGDAFQVNLAQRLLFPAKGDAVSLYQRLRDRNPATFAGYFDAGAFQIVSASPERFVRVLGGDVEARPIKGTRQRTSLPEADLYAAEGLRQSEKDRAENVMIVDLLRNDLSRVCRADSVRVTQLCELETYQYVQHLVSAVEGRLAEGRTAVDLARAAFPGGSITGAPKVRAMEIIAELEPTARGAYCGSLGYVGFDGAMDLSILIRTITAARGWWQAPVGGGIVAQSLAEDEYEETWHKAHGLLEALR
ncbi:MAG: aminodeoxychorismate synthase component I [Pirellulaceae bacterium]